MWEEPMWGTPALVTTRALSLLLEVARTMWCHASTVRRSHHSARVVIWPVTVSLFCRTLQEVNDVLHRVLADPNVLGCGQTHCHDAVMTFAHKHKHDIVCLKLQLKKGL